MRRNLVMTWVWTVVVVCLWTGVAGAQGTQKDDIIKSLNFQNANIHTVLNFLAEYADINIVSAPTVEGTVTFNLQNVTWDQALEIVTRTYGLTAVQENGYVRVVPTADYQAERAAYAKSNVEHRMLVPLTTEILQVNYAAAEELISPVKSLLSERGTVEADHRTNQLIIREVPGNLATLVEFITALDRPIRQIKISAKLVEISTEDLFELGVRWAGTYTDAGDILGNPGPLGGTPGNEKGWTGGVESNKVSDKVGNFTFSALTNGINLEAQISALAASGKVRVVAHPEITTVDNSEARIQMGQKIPIKQFDQAGNVVIEFTEVGTILRVTPHIMAGNRILMHLFPERSTYQFDPNGVIINTSNAETKVVVNNGQTAVIGGLTTQDVIESHVGVPFLKDIPLIGHLFGYTQRKTIDRDLVIFVTPTIVDTEDMAMHSSTGTFGSPGQ